MAAKPKRAPPMLFIALLLGVASAIGFTSNLITGSILGAMTAVCIVVYFYPAFPSKFIAEGELKKEGKIDVKKGV